MEWQCPPGYAQLSDPVPTFYPDGEIDTAEADAASLYAAQRSIAVILKEDARPLQLVVGRASDAKLFPSPPRPTEIAHQLLQFPFVSRDCEPPAIVCPVQLAAPVRPVTDLMKRLLLWREVARYAVYDLPVSAHGFWPMELVAWYGGVCVAREMDLSLAETIAKMHDGRLAPAISSYSEPGGWNGDDLMSLHKQLVALTVELHYENGSALLTALASEFRESSGDSALQRLASALGPGGDAWLAARV